jgi:dTDP-4-amino-4,6-dideoxygalactose transaminase
MIPVLDLRRQYKTIEDEIGLAVRDVFERGAFINGPNVAAFEEEVAAYLGAGFAVGLNSGTDALHLALRALDIGPGDEVITTPFTFVATSEAIGMVGATPVFADIDPRTYTLDPRAVEAAVTPRTRAILPVHLYGLPAPMQELMAIARRHGIAVVEDCAQSIGATFEGRATGTFGDVGCFSFFPSKNLGAYGDGGMAVTADPQIARRIRALRAHGATKKYYHEELGVNSRLDELQAAILRIKLRRLPQWNEARRRVAAAYTNAFSNVPGIQVPVEPPDSHAVYHQYTVGIDDRNATQTFLREGGVETMVYYPVPLHLQDVHRAMNLGEGSFPVSENAAQRVLSLPMFPEIEEAEIRTVVETLIASTQRTAQALSA